VRALGTRLVFSLFVALLAACGPGCGSRDETPVADADSTLVYVPKSGQGPTARITLCRRVSQKSGRRLGVSRVFTLGEQADVEACVDVENALALGSRELMFHLAWLGPGEDEFFTKRVDITPTDSVMTISSSISIPVGKREPGEYALKVYLFRELIAQKRFLLLSPEGQTPTAETASTTPEAAPD